MEKEIWKDITDYEGLYQVSNLGRVRSLDRTIIYRNGKKYFYKGKILKPSKDCCGYQQVTLCKDGKARNFFVHRLVGIEFILNPFNLPQLNHKNGEKFKNTVSNLEWVTPKENMQHAFKHGLQKTGEKHPRAKLTQRQVNKIRQLYSTGCYSMSDFAKKYDVDKKTIFKIIHNKTYKPE